MINGKAQLADEQHGMEKLPSLSGQGRRATGKAAKPETSSKTKRQNLEGSAAGSGKVLKWVPALLLLGKDQAGHDLHGPHRARLAPFVCQAGASFISIAPGEVLAQKQRRELARLFRSDF